MSQFSPPPKIWWVKVNVLIIHRDIVFKFHIHMHNFKPKKKEANLHSKVLVMVPKNIAWLYFCGFTCECYNKCLSITLFGFYFIFHFHLS